ncbi:MAG: pilus assembly protein PilM, partial [Candidatus Gracilibacteria bacterium]
MSIISKKIVGIDFHDFSAELVEMSVRGDKKYLEAYSRAVIPSDIITNGDIMKSDELKTILLSLFENANPHPIETKNVAITFPSSKVMTHIFTFPANLSENEIRNALPYEAETVIPFSMTDIYWDFTIIEKDPNSKKHPSQYVLFACINKQIADKYLALFEEMGVTPTIFSITADALRYSLPKDTFENKTSLIIDVDTLSVNYLILDNVTIKHFFSTNEGGYKLIHAIAKELQLTENAIIDKKEKNKLEDISKIEKIEEFIEKNYKRAQKIIEEYESENSNKKIDQILLTGKFLNLPNFKKLADTYFPNQKVEIGDPKMGLIIEPTKFNTEDVKKGEYNPYSIYFNNAIGSALRALNHTFSNGINLLPDKLKESFSAKKTSLILAIATIAMTAIALIAGTYLTFKLQNLNYERKHLSVQKAAIENMIYGTRYQEIRDQILAFNKEVTDLSTIDSNLFSVPTTLSEIYKLMPAGVNIKSFKFMDDKLTLEITGIADTRDTLLQTQKNLEKAEFIKEVISPISNYDE